MATKKGSKVHKTTETSLRFEILSPHEHEWGVVVEGDGDDETAIAWVKEVTSRMRGGAVKYRLIESTVTTRVQTSETILEGEGKESAPAFPAE